jgi:hypothetical protein
MTPVSVEDTRAHERGTGHCSGERLTLNSSLQIYKVVRGDILCGRSLDNLQVAKCSEFYSKILEGLGCLIHK